MLHTDFLYIKKIYFSECEKISFIYYYPFFKREKKKYFYLERKNKLTQKIPNHASNYINRFKV